jgi:AcrR family transcriptional regulator
MARARGLPSRRARRPPPGDPTRVNGRRVGHEQVLEIQRRRLLAAAALVVTEQGVAAFSVSEVLRHASMSRRTFYEIYEDREQCLAELMEQTLQRVAVPVLAAWHGQQQWLLRVRAAVAELLWQLRADPVAARLLLVEAQGAGPPTARLRARATNAMAAALDEGSTDSRAGELLPASTAEGLVGGALWILHTRVLEGRTVELEELAGSLTSMLVLPYVGSAAARREFERPAPQREDAGGGEQASNADGGGALPQGLKAFPARLTHRTAQVLLAIGSQPGASNRAIGQSAGIADQGQISKLLRRLEGIGLIENAGGNGRGASNAWRLTTQGQAMVGIVGDPARPQPRR